jgi:sirohydrochlorin cobaltochelatase
MNASVKKGVILFAHGSRDPNWRLPFEAIMGHVRRQDDRPSALAFLECMTPSLPEAIEQMVSTGIQEICVVPLFLAVGSHVRKDLPLLLEQARTLHPQLSIHATAALGEQEDMQSAIAAFALKMV